MSLIGDCPACGTDLTTGGNPDCSTCAAEPSHLTEVRTAERDIIVVILSDEVKAWPSADILAFLAARYPDHRALPVSHDSYLNWTDAGVVAVLDLNIGG